MTASTPAQAIRPHRMALSGHCHRHRVELFLSLLRLPRELAETPVGLAE